MSSTATPLPTITVPGPGLSWSMQPPELTAGSSPGAGPLPLADLLMSEASIPPEVAAEARLVVRACLLELADADRLLVELRFFHGWSRDDIAALAGGTPLEVSRTLGRILARLAHRMGESDPGASFDGVVDT